jgi:hypothetical protein
MHVGIPEIPLPESMVGKPSPGERALLQAVALSPHYLVTIANLSFSKELFAYYHLQKNWSTASTNSTHIGTPEIPLTESMVGQPSPGKRTLLQAVVLAPHYLVSIANLPFSKHFFA